MRLALAMLELTCPAHTEHARSLTSDAPRRGRVRERQRLKEAVGVDALKGPVHVVVAVGVDQVGHAHGRVAAHGQRDGHLAQHGVAPVWKRRALRAARILQKVHLAVDNRQQRLRQIVLLHARPRTSRPGWSPRTRCRHGSPRCDRFFISTRSCSLTCSAKPKVGRGRGVRLLDALAVERLLGDQRAALVVGLGREARATRGLGVRDRPGPWRCSRPRAPARRSRTAWRAARGCRARCP